MKVISADLFIKTLIFAHGEEVWTKKLVQVDTLKSKTLKSNFA